MIEKVIIIEDSWDEGARAREVVKAAGFRTDRAPASDFQRAIERLRWGESDYGPRFAKTVGVLTDLYFPAKPGDGGEFGEPAPLGMLVMAECQRLGIPCVIVTAGDHHGSRYHQVCVAGRQLGWPEMVDACIGEEEAKEKNWAEGLKRLLALVEQKSGAG